MSNEKPKYHTPTVLTNPTATYRGYNPSIINAIDAGKSVNLGNGPLTMHPGSENATKLDTRYVNNHNLDAARADLLKATNEAINNSSNETKKALQTSIAALHDTHHGITGIRLDADMWIRKDIEAIGEFVQGKYKQLDKLIPKQAQALIATGVTLVTAISEASANTSDNALTKTSKVLNAATEDIGGGAARAAVAGDYDTAQREALDLVVPGADQVLRSKEAQMVIDALPKDRETLAKVQSNSQLPPIDRHLAEYKLRFLEAREGGSPSDLIEGMSASSTLTQLAEKKVELQKEWAANATTYTAAVNNPGTNWRQFKKEHPELAIQADLHQAAVNTVASNPNIGSQFVTLMDKNIAENTARGTPMDQVHARLNAFDLQAQQQTARQEAAQSLSM